MATPGQRSDGKRLKRNDLSKLLGIVKEASSSWQVIGDSLGFSEGDLKNIESMPTLITKGVEGFIRETLIRWLKWAPPKHDFPTVEKLAEALRSAGEEDIALELEEQMLGQTQPGPQASKAGSTTPPPPGASLKPPAFPSTSPSDKNPKLKLKEYCEQNKLDPPCYIPVAASQQRFKMRVVVKISPSLEEVGNECGRKAEAEQSAAQKALMKLDPWASKWSPGAGASPKPSASPSTSPSDKNPKSKLKEYCEQNKLDPPRYIPVPASQQRFRMRVVVKISLPLEEVGNECGRKAEAEQSAAQKALKKLQI